VGKHRRFIHFDRKLVDLFDFKDAATFGGARWLANKSAGERCDYLFVDGSATSTGQSSIEGMNIRVIFDFVRHPWHQTPFAVWVSQSGVVERVC